MLRRFVTIISLLIGVKYLPNDGFVRYIHRIIFGTFQSGDRTAETDNFLHQFFCLLRIVRTHPVASGRGTLNCITGTVCIHNHDIIMYWFHCVCTTFPKYYSSSFKSFSLIQPHLRKTRQNAQLKMAGRMKQISAKPIQSMTVMAAFAPVATSLIQPVYTPI